MFSLAVNLRFKEIVYISQLPYRETWWFVVRSHILVAECWDGKE